MTDITPGLLDRLSDADLRELDAIESAGHRESLAEFFLRAQPDYDHPAHLFAFGVDKNGNPGRSLGHTLAETVDTPQQASFSTPPQFGKSILVLVALAWFAMRVARSVSAYVSYNDKIVREQSDKCWRICWLAGLEPTGSKSRIALNNGSVILFSTIRGGLEGMAVTGIAVLDDPYKNRSEAESPIERDFVRRWFISTFLGRTHPTTSVLIIGHRWTADDLISVMDDQSEPAARFPWTNYPAIWPNGASLWEQFKSAVWLNAKRLLVGFITWESEYQGRPMARGGRLFEGVYRWSLDGRDGTVKLPDRHLLKIAIGVDLAYTEKTASDWSVAIVLAEHNARWFVLEVHRDQVRASVFADRLKLLQARYPGSHMRWHGSTTEKGAADAMRHLGKINLQGVQAVGKPYDRAQLVGAAWCRQAVMVPSLDNANDPIAVETFINVLTSFSGGDGAQDDDVAALASAFEQLPARPLAPTVSVGSPEWIMRQREETRKMLESQVLAKQRQKERGVRR